MVFDDIELQVGIILDYATKQVLNSITNKYRVVTQVAKGSLKILRKRLPNVAMDFAEGGGRDLGKGLVGAEKAREDREAQVVPMQTVRADQTSGAFLQGLGPRQAVAF